MAKHEDADVAAMIDCLAARLRYLLIDKGEGEIKDMRILAEDLVFVACDAGLLRATAAPKGGGEAL